MHSFASEYLRQTPSGQSGYSNTNEVPSTSDTWNSHYSLTDISMSRKGVEGESTMCNDSQQQPLCRELNFCDLPEEIRCMYEVAKCGLPIADSFHDGFQDSMMQHSNIMDQTPLVFRRSSDHHRQFENDETPTWEEFKSSVDDASSGHWDLVCNEGEKRYQELMEESFKYVAVVESATTLTSATTEVVDDNTVVPGHELTENDTTCVKRIAVNSVKDEPVSRLREVMQLILVSVVSLLILVVLPMSPMFYFKSSMVFDDYEFFEI